MGVQLTGIVPTKAISLADLKGKTIAIDAYNTIYQFLSIIRDRVTGEPLRDANGQITSHLSGLFYRSTRLMAEGITPVYVFDGKPPELKKAVVAQRIQARQQALEKWNQALEEGDLEQARKEAQRSSRLTKEMVEQAKELLAALGIAYVQAPSEGEAQAAYLCRTGKVYAAASQDWDSLLFGTPRLVRNLAISGKRKVAGKEKYVEVEPELIVLDEVLAHLRITLEQLISLAILVGTDFNPDGIKGIGPKKALKLVQDKKELNAILTETGWPFAARPEEIVQIFQGLEPVDADIRPGTLDQDQVRRIMVTEHNFSQERVDKSLAEMQAAGRQQQNSLGRFF
ncbi:MAG: flap endonuclease-1 [Candidatus Aenigmarchaeota archaeon]|nr:flap endonuclease-1 [Candidatus Aenigmarchaeota archaeon]